MNKKIQPIVRLIDDDSTVLDSQSFFLRLCGWETVTYSNAMDFLEQDDLLHPGCVVLDVRMPGMTGLELQDEIIHKKIDLPIIFLSAHGDIEMAIACLKKGAFNFLEKPAEPEKLQKLVEEAIKKNQIDRREADYRKKLKKAFDCLTKSEKQIAYLVAKGLSNSEISQLLVITERTVQAHRSAVFEKLNVANAVELADFVRDMNKEVLT